MFRLRQRMGSMPVADKPEHQDLLIMCGISECV